MMKTDDAGQAGRTTERDRVRWALALLRLADVTLRVVEFFD